LSAPAPPADDLEEFYARLVSIKEFHRKNPDVDSRAVESEIRTLVEGPDYSNEDELAADRESTRSVSSSPRSHPPVRRRRSLTCLASVTMQPSRVSSPERSRSVDSWTCTFTTRNTSTSRASTGQPILPGLPQPIDVLSRPAADPGLTSQSPQDSLPRLPRPALKGHAGCQACPQGEGFPGLSRVRTPPSCLHPAPPRASPLTSRTRSV
jgi:hypothetical protein